MTRLKMLFRITFTLSVMLCTLTSCSQIRLPELNLPQFGFGENPTPILPISVSYAFDTSVTQSTLEVNACGIPYTINTGDIIPQAFLAVGRKRFVSVVAYSGLEQAGQPSDLTIRLQLVQQSFQPADRIAEEDRFLAFINVQMLAVFIDPAGRQLAQTPLQYSDQVRIWTPALTSQSVSCSTGQLNSEMRNAAEELAQQLVDVVPQLTGQDRQPVTAQMAPARQTPVLPPQTHRALTFRTMLKDANNNLIIEGNEALALLIEATNSGAHQVSAVTIELTGSPTIIKAFSDRMPLPIALGDFQPGETKTMEVRGQMPFQIPEPKGELMVTLTTHDGSIVGSHRILAVLRSATPTTEKNVSPQRAVRPHAQKPQSRRK